MQPRAFSSLAAITITSWDADMSSIRFGYGLKWFELLWTRRRE